VIGLFTLPNTEKLGVAAQAAGLKNAGGLFVDSPESGLTKSERIDLGLNLLSLASIRGVPLSADDLAAWADCSPKFIQSIEAKAIAKLRRRMPRTGIDLADLPEGRGGVAAEPGRFTTVD
jgi:hypothetical protein